MVIGAGCVAGKFVIPEVIDHLRFNLNGHIIDGELILPGNVPLQDTSSALKKYQPGISEQLLYIVYDVVETTMPFSERYALLQTLVKTSPKNVILAPTFMAKTDADVMKNHRKFVSEGYEGVIIRDDSNGYEIGHRSNQLQKYKDFVDDEFEIIAVNEGEGTFRGCYL